MTNLIILCYGRKSEHQRAVLAVLSYFAWLGEAANQSRAIVFTDDPAYLQPYFMGLPVEYKLLTPERMQQIIGPAKYVHRLKIAIIDDAFRAHPGDDLFFIDSDTFILANPIPLLKQISPTVSLMHVLEYALNESPQESKEEVEKLIQLFESGPISTSRGEEQFYSFLYSWNSGVLGLSATVAAHMPDVFLLNDEIYARSKWHISEQLAFSLVLQTRTRIIASDNIVYHYWQKNKKFAIDAILANTITDAFASLPVAEKVKNIKSLTSQLPKQIETYLYEHPEIEVREQAIYHLHMNDFKTGYKLAGKYLARKPADFTFIRIAFYYTKRMLRKKLSAY